MSTTHEILILGGNLGGVTAAHHILQKAIPQLTALSAKQTYHVTIVSPSSEWYFKIGAPRALINKTLIPLDAIFKPIADAFADYPAGQFTFHLGTAIGLDPKARTVTVRSGAEPDAPTTTLPYGTLVIATGTTANSALWTLNGPASLSTAAFEALHAALPSAKTVLIAGGGAAGVETAGEVKDAYPSAQVTLLSGDKRVLTGTLPATSARAAAYLARIGIKLEHDVRVAGSSAADGGATTVELSDGTARTVDVYIDATGGRPNSRFLPADWLDERRRVKAKDLGTRVDGADAAGVYVIGDVAAYTRATLIETFAAIPPLVSSIVIDVAAALGVTAAAQPGRGFLGGLFGRLFGGSAVAGVPKQVEFAPLKDTIGVPIGPHGGVGQVMGWRMPSFIVTMLKGKTFFVEKAVGIWKRGEI